MAVLGARGLAGAEALLHDDDVLLPVEDERGEVRGDEGVDAPGGAGQKDVGVDGRRAEGAGHDAEDVDEAHPQRAVTQLQREADEELHDHVEQNVLNSWREGDKAFGPWRLWSSQFVFGLMRLELPA